MEIAPHIIVDSDIHHGTPAIAGIRVPAEIILTQTQVEAVLSYAAMLSCP